MEFLEKLHYAIKRLQEKYGFGAYSNFLENLREELRGGVPLSEESEKDLKQSCWYYLFSFVIDQYAEPDDEVYYELSDIKEYFTLPNFLFTFDDLKMLRRLIEDQKRSPKTIKRVLNDLNSIIKRE